MANEKMMTNKAFYEAVIAANLGAEVTEKAEHLLELVNAKAGKVSKATAEKRQANAEQIEVLFSSMESGKVYTAGSVATDFSIVSVQKASYLLREMVAQNLLVEVEAKNGSRKVKGYKVRESEV